MNTQKITLTTSDDVDIEVERQVAEHSSVIRDLLEDLVPDSSQAIPILAVNEETMRKVIEWCEHQENDDHSDSIMNSVDIDEWDRSFVKNNCDYLIDIILAANYLEVDSLLSLGCKTVANMIFDIHNEERHNIDRNQERANDNHPFYGHSQVMMVKRFCSLPPEVQKMILNQLRPEADVTTRIVNFLCKNVRSRDDKRTEVIVQHGLLNLDWKGEEGETLLIAAVTADNAVMTRQLVGLGAIVDSFGMWEGKSRTALQVAAAKGNLPVVKLLVGECGADDALLAPDGQLALRLAVDGGHREVVDYLPVRRGGAWRRWKAHHDVAMRRIKRAFCGIHVFFKYLMWYPLRFLFYKGPKHCIVLPMQHAGRWTWENGKKLGPWCHGQIKTMPNQVWRGVQAVTRVIKRAGKATWEETKKTPDRAKAAMRWMWRCIRAIARVIKRAGKATWEETKKTPDRAKAAMRWMWRCIRAIARVIKRAGKATWEETKKTPDRAKAAMRWMWRCIRAIARVIKRAGKATWEETKKTPDRAKAAMRWMWRCIRAIARVIKRAGKATWEETKKTPDRAKAAMRWMWRCIQRIIAALRIVGEWIGSCLERITIAVANAVLRVVALVHTALSGFVTFFRRITLRDVWNAIYAVFRAVFVELPKAIWSAVETFGDMSYRAMEAMFGFCGKALWWVVLTLLCVVTYVPTKIGLIFLWLGSLVTKGAQEVLVWINPKW